jgi:integrase
MEKQAHGLKAIPDWIYTCPRQAQPELEEILPERYSPAGRPNGAQAVGDGVSAAWRNFPRKVSSAMFAAALKQGYLNSNPVRSVELPPETAKSLQVLRSEEQLTRLLDELPESYRTMVWLVCIRGVCIGELFALRWRAVDWDRNCFWVEEAV